MKSWEIGKMHQPQRTSARILIISLIGPLIGSFIYVVTVFFISAGPKTVTDFIEIAPTGIFLFWFLGLFPAMIAATCWALLPIPKGLWLRVGLAAFVGLAAVISFIGTVIAALGLQVAVSQFVTFVPMGLSGAVAMLVTAIPGSKRD